MRQAIFSTRGYYETINMVIMGRNSRESGIIWSKISINEYFKEPLLSQQTRTLKLSINKWYVFFRVRFYILVHPQKEQVVRFLSKAIRIDMYSWQIQNQFICSERDSQKILARLNLFGKQSAWVLYFETSIILTSCRVKILLVEIHFLSVINRFTLRYHLS